MNMSQSLRELYSARRLDEAWAAYGRLLGGEPVSAEDHLTGGLTARLRGDLRGARMALERGLQAGPAGATLGKLLMTYGVVVREIGEPRTAIDYLREFILRMDEYPELRPVALGAGYHNLGMAYRGARQYIDAVQAYDFAIAEFRQESMHQYLRESLWSQAWALCFLGDGARADEALDESEALCDGSPSCWYQTLGRGFAHAVAGRRTEALHASQAVIDSGEAPPDVMSHACWVAGRVLLDMGQIASAEDLQAVAVTWALKSQSDTRCLQDAQDLKRQIYEAQHRQTEGA